MTTEELFIELTSKPKWYAGYCKHNTASMLKTRFKEETLSAKKIEEIFTHFGFTKITQEQWGPK
jgi:hypothetical protein